MAHTLSLSGNQHCSISHLTPWIVESIKRTVTAARLFVSLQLKGISMETSCRLLWELASRTRLHCACISTLILRDYFPECIGDWRDNTHGGNELLVLNKRGRPLQAFTYHASALHITWYASRENNGVAYWHTWQIQQRQSIISVLTAHVLNSYWSGRIKSFC